MAQTLLDQKQAVRALPPSTRPWLHLAYLQVAIVPLTTLFWIVQATHELH